MNASRNSRKATMLFGMAGFCIFCVQPSVAARDRGYVAPVRLPILTDSVSANPRDESRMFGDINRIRRAAGLPALVRDPKTAVMARRYAYDMAARHYFGHYNPEMQTMRDRLHSVGITYQCAGENIAVANDENEAMRAFLRSADHRANILRPNYTRVGIGIIATHKYGSIYVQEFTGGARQRNGFRRYY